MVEVASTGWWCEESILICSVAASISSSWEVESRWERQLWAASSLSMHYRQPLINHLISSHTISVRGDRHVMLGLILFFREPSLLALLVIVVLFSSSSALQEFRPLLYRLVNSTVSSPSWENLLSANKRPTMELPLSKPTTCSFVLEFIPAVTHSLDLCIAGELRLLNGLKCESQSAI